MLSYKAFKGGICMIIANRINTHFTNLIGDENLANAYFLNKSIDDFSVERLHDLEKKYDSASKKYNFVAQLLSVSKFIGTDSLIKKSALRLEKEHKRLLSVKNELEVFESNLAYFILSGKITSLDELGFSSEYVTELLEKKKKELNNSTVEYSYDESTGRTYQVINSKYLALSHTPDVVADKVRQNRKQVVGEKSLIIR